MVAVPRSPAALALGMGLVLLTLAPLAAAAEAEAEAEAQAPAQQVVLYLHRNGGMDPAPPVAPEGAAWVFGLAGADEARFVSGPLAEAWTLRAPAVLTFTLALQLGLGGGVAGILDVDGRPIAATTVPGPLAPGVQEVALTFRDFRVAIPAGQRIGITLLAAPALDAGAAGIGLGEGPDGAPADSGTVRIGDGGLLAPLAPLGLGDLDDVAVDVGGDVDALAGSLGLPSLGLGGLLDGLGLPGVTIAPQLPDPGDLAAADGTLVGVVVYDAVSHPARLALVREVPAPAPPANPPPAAGPGPAPPAGDGGDRTGDGSGAGPAPVVPIGDAALEGFAGGFDPLTLLIATGTAAVAALSGLALRGRDVLG